jgi:hypothetical protein
MKVYFDKTHRLGQFISLPIIWSLAVPFIIADIWTEIYHRICFPLYGLKCIKRSNYIKIDRHRLEYLNFWQKIGCAYCGYANGLVTYWVAIYAETERYWCGIMHKNSPGFNPPAHHKDFPEYGNKKAFEEKYK